LKWWARGQGGEWRKKGIKGGDGRERKEEEGGRGKKEGRWKGKRGQNFALTIVFKSRHLLGPQGQCQGPAVAKDEPENGA